MSNDFYNHDGSPTAQSRGLSSVIRAALAAIGAAFDKMPTMTGNANKVVVVNSGGTALIPATTSQLQTALALGTTDTVTFGALTVTGATSLAANTTGVTASVGDSTTKFATTAFVQTAALSASLPLQTGNAGKVMTTDGTTASWEKTLTNSQDAATDFAVSNTNAGSSAATTFTATANAGSLVGKAGSTASAYGASVLWGGTAGPMTMGTTGAADVKVTVANTVRTTYANATGYQAHNTTPSIAGTAYSFVASHNSVQSLAISNSDAGAAAVATSAATSNNGTAQMFAYSTAAGAIGGCIWTGTGSAIFGASSNVAVEIRTNNIARIEVGASTVNIKAGSGALRTDGHISRADITYANNVTGASVYSAVAHGGTRAPDLFEAYGIMNAAVFGHAIGDKVQFLGANCSSRADATNVFFRQSATPVINSASTGAASTLAASDVAIHIVCHWL